MRVLTGAQQDHLMQFERKKFYVKFLDEIFDAQSISEKRMYDLSFDDFKEIRLLHDLGRNCGAHSEGFLYHYLLAGVLFRDSFIGDRAAQKKLSDKSLSEREKLLVINKAIKSNLEKTNRKEPLPEWVIAIDSNESNK